MGGRARYGAIPDGLEKVEVPGDGACLFHALLKANIQWEGDKPTALELRENVLQYIKNNAKTFAPAILGETGATVDTYVQIMRAEPSTWGGQPEIAAIEQMLGVKTIIIRPDGQHVIPLNEKLKDPIIFIHYNGYNHYSALGITEGHSALEIAQSIQETRRQQETERKQRQAPIVIENWVKVSEPRSGPNIPLPETGHMRHAELIRHLRQQDQSIHLLRNDMDTLKRLNTGWFKTLRRILFRRRFNHLTKEANAPRISRYTDDFKDAGIWLDQQLSGWMQWQSHTATEWCRIDDHLSSIQNFNHLKRDSLKSLNKYIAGRDYYREDGKLTWFGILMFAFLRNAALTIAKLKLAKQAIIDIEALQPGETKFDNTKQAQKLDDILDSLAEDNAAVELRGPSYLDETPETSITPDTTDVCLQSLQEAPTLGLKKEDSPASETDSVAASIDENTDAIPVHQLSETEKNANNQSTINHYHRYNFFTMSGLGLLAAKHVDDIRRTFGLRRG